MKKIFLKHTFAKEAELRQNSELENLLIIAYRKDKTLYLQNIEVHPKDAMRVSFNAESGYVELRFKLSDTEFLALGDSKGVTKKISIELP
jgi:hypothetical protein